MNKKLSIITINYNNLAGLQKTVESIMSQTWQEFEYIVIDGGSTDGGAAYLESQSDNINYWVSEPDKGIYNAMNKGIAKATGEYLLFLNSGDHLYNNEVLNRNQDHISNHDLVCFNLLVIGEVTSDIILSPKELRFSYFFDGGTLCHPSTFIKKALFDVVGLYDENLKIVSDWKFFTIALCKFNATYKYVDTVFSTFYIGGLSTLDENKSLMVEERTKVLNEEFFIYLSDLKENFVLKRIIRNLRKSRKIDWLIRLGLLDKF
jgi:glycosyltransferase involved in cell wall biosynthesis